MVNMTQRRQFSSLASVSRSQPFLRLGSAIRHPGYLVSRGVDRLVGGFERLKYRSIERFRSLDGAPVTQREYRILGLRRSGNHAIINWMERQMDSAIHLNNLRINENAFRNYYRACVGKCHPLDRWMAEEIQRYPEYQGPEGVDRLLQESKGHFFPKQNLLLSYEDYPIPSIANAGYETMHDRYFGRSLHRVDVLILRDPHNLLASRLHNNMLPSKSMRQSFSALWTSYAMEFLGETNHLTHNKVSVNYNRWVLSTTYRQELAAELGLQFSDRGFGDVTGFGGGSSFDSSAYDGRAHEMDLLNRWKHYRDNPEFKELLNDERLHRYARKIFTDNEFPF
jgi:hypothetical protein